MKSWLPLEQGSLKEHNREVGQRELPSEGQPMNQDAIEVQLLNLGSQVVGELEQNHEQNPLRIKGMDTGNKLHRLEPQSCHLQVTMCNPLSVSRPQVSHLRNGDNN